MSTMETDTAAAAAPEVTEPVEKTQATPEPSDLEKSVMAFAATNPTDGKLLMERIASIQRKLNDANDTVAKLETQSLDTELIRNSMEQLLKHLTPDAAKRYLVDANINDQLLSPKPGISQNAMHRLIAACNSTFMSATPVSEKPNARSVDSVDTLAAAAPKRTRVAEPSAVAPPISLPTPASDAMNDADMLRHALSAQYN